MPISGIIVAPAPTAMPTATAKMTNAVSRVSSTTVRNRTMASAPTRLNARAMLLPMANVTMAMITVRSTSVAESAAGSLAARPCVSR